MNIKKIIIKNKLKENRGVAVLFAVLVAVLMVSVAATMVSIAMRQTILSNTGRDSQYAMFAANTALECALFWDLNYGASVTLSTSTDRIFPNTNFNETRPGDFLSKDVKCNGGNILTGAGFNSGFAGPAKLRVFTNPNETTFYLEITPNDGNSYGSYCASATVKKGIKNGAATTVIETRGYNTCNLNSPRAIERGLELSYTS
jgi:hypothetical protein